MARLFSVLIVMLCLAQIGSAEGMRKLTVIGEGRADAAPDMATIRLGVSHQAKDPQDAMALTTEAAQAISDRLQTEGLTPRDIQTSDLSLHPIWNHSSSGSGEREISGYQSNLQVQVRVRNLDNLGQIVSLVVQDGANNFGGLQFGLQYPDPVEDEARRDAVKRARAKATLYARAAGVELGDLLELSEGGGSHGPSPRVESMRMAADAAMPVDPGELSITASVTLIYAIKPKN